MSKTPLQILQSVWGYPSFRGLQENIIQSVLEKNDTMALLATGGGKSLCFQIPTLLQEGVCLVVSPLIALIEDQIQNLKNKNIKAFSFTQKITNEDLIRELNNVAYNDTKFIYMAPERFKNPIILEQLKRLNICLIAIDEAHCISQWGHDFRPDYLKLFILKQIFPQTNIIALTATATPKVLEDIHRQLLLKNVKIFKDSFKRKNLAYQILQVDNKYSKLFSILKETPKPSIVYTDTRKTSENIARWVKNQGIDCVFYHGGLSNEQKKHAYELWHSEKVSCMVATNAFGMGIDKGNIKNVIHFNLPQSIENYMQEAGRAGRDGQQAFAITLFNPNEDAERFKKKLEIEKISIKDLKKTWVALNHFFKICKNELPEHTFDFDIKNFCKKFHFLYKNTLQYLDILQRYELIALKNNTIQKESAHLIESHHFILNYCKSKTKHAELVQTLLRHYAGIFNQYIYISSKYLAEKLNDTHENIIRLLDELTRQNILQYKPSNFLATLQFLVPREDDLNINPIVKKIKNQEKLKRKRLVDIWYFMSGNQVCKEKELLKYFGEKNTKSCGICNHCIKTKNVPKNMEQQILNLFEKEHLLSIKGICHHLKQDKELIINHLRDLLDEDILKMNADFLFYLNMKNKQ